jgi:nucleoside-diphosphate-sugar epimerase
LTESTPVLVTGGAGFVGSHLVDRLLDMGRAVTVLDNFTTGSERNLAGRNEHPGLRVVRGSVLDADVVDALVAQHPLVFHLAAAVGVGNIVADPLGGITTNVHGTENVFAAASRHDSRVLLASTSEVYGRSDKVPFREDGDRVLGPTSVHRWSYATAKALDEHIAFAYADRGVNISIVRYFNSYGPRIDERGYGSVIARFAAQALAGRPITVHGDGKQTRCFTFVSDTVDGTIRAGTMAEAIGGVFNIGSDREISILELARMIKSTLASPSEIVLEPYEAHYPKGFEDTRRRVPDVSKAKSDLGYVAQVPLDAGLGRTLDWCRNTYRVSLAS